MSAFIPPGSGAHDDPGSAREAMTSRYSGLYTPVDGVFAKIARMGALVFDAAIASVNIAGDARLWLPASEGPADGGTLQGPSPSTGLGLSRPDFDAPQPSAAAYVIEDTAAAPRTRQHPWVTGQDRIRFLAVAAIQGHMAVA